MPRPRRKVEASLEHKGFQRNETHHHQFIYYTREGKKTRVRTRTSHGMQEIGDNLLGQMATQCKLTKKDFLNLVDCPLDRLDFEAKVAEHF